MSFPAPKFIDADTAASLLDLDTCIVAVEAAFRARAEGRAFPTSLSHVDTPDGEFHIKAGGLSGERSYFACKINGGFFNNRSRFGLPNILGLIILSDAVNGVPLAVMDSRHVTMLRTGAASAVAAKYLARPESATVLVCGAGTQAAIQLKSLCRVLPIQSALVWSRSDVSDFCQAMSAELSIPVAPAGDLLAAARSSDVIVTCTPSAKWFLASDMVGPGTFIAAVGADSPTKQELEPTLVARSAVYCDITDQCAHVGEFHHAIEASLMTASDVRADIGQVIAGRRPGRQSADEITLFDSTGTALQDVAAAAAVYERALEQ